MKIKAVCEVEYDVEEVMNDMRKDYPELDFGMDDAKGMIHQWIKDDFGGIHMEYRIEEING